MRILGWEINRSDSIEKLSKQNQALGDGIVKLANACESLERALIDRMDVVEGWLAEMKPKELQASAVVPGHKRWTQRRDERASKHFNIADFQVKLNQATTEKAANE